MSTASPAAIETAVVKKGRGGRVKGVPVPASTKTVEANRLQAFKHGRYAKIASHKAVMHRLAEELIHPDAPGIIEAIAEAMDGGSRDGYDAMVTVGLAEAEVLRRLTVNEIAKRGMMIEESLVDKDGNQIAVRLRANPLIEQFHKFNQDLGISADQMQLSRKSRGEGAKDDAIAAALRRDNQLRGMDKSGMAPPAD